MVAGVQQMLEVAVFLRKFRGTLLDPLLQFVVGRPQLLFALLLVIDIGHAAKPARNLASLVFLGERT